MSAGLLVRADSVNEGGVLADVAGPSRSSVWVMAGILFTFLAVNLPLFLCMPVDCDIHFYDVCARNLLNGGVHYRDTFDTNLPGMPWLHAGVRYLLGWSLEALRFVDFLVLTGVIVFLTRWLPSSVSRSSRLALALILYTLYFSMTEWCHCQRDLWMLLPCLLAAELRSRQINRLANHQRSRSIAGWSFIEGLIWSIGFWIKPYVIVPAFACWITSAVLVRRRAGSRLLALDGLAILGGGLASGAMGIFWLWQSGSWPYFRDIFFVWNQDYVGFDMTEDLGWLFIAGSFVRFFPWVMVHVMAVALAIQVLFSPLSPVLRGEGSGVRGSKSLAEPDISTRDANPLTPTPLPLSTGGEGSSGAIRLAAILYLSWLFQAVILQHYFDYIQLPAILLGIALVAWFCATTSKIILKCCLLAFLFLCPILRYPVQLGHRWPYWERSLATGSSAEVKDGLTLLHRVEWQDLKKVEDFLREQNVKDEELTCFSIQAISLYNTLNVRPSMRHLILQGGYTIFANHRTEIGNELNSSKQRYVVVDLWRKKLDYHDIPGQAGDTDLPDWIFPKNFKELYPQPVVLLFRAGRYVVLGVAEGEGPGLP
jgi:hypothetical protein